MTMVDSDGFTRWKSREHLQKMRDRIGGDIEYFKDYTGVEMTTRTAVCMVALTMSRPEIVDILGGTVSMIRSWIANSVQTEYPFRVDVPSMPMEDRIHIA